MGIASTYYYYLRFVRYANRSCALSWSTVDFNVLRSESEANAFFIIVTEPVPFAHVPIYDTIVLLISRVSSSLYQF